MVYNILNNLWRYAMNKLRYLTACLYCALMCVFMNITAFAEGAEEFTEADRRIFGIFPIWLFLLILAGAVMVTIIIIVEIFKRKNK